MPWRLAQFASVLVLALGPRPGASQLAVIFDNGHTEPLAPYLEVFDETPDAPEDPQPPGPVLGAADLRNLLPIRSPGLSPGPVPAKAHSRPHLRPFFLIGADAHSRRWLARHRDHLQSIGAAGLLVQADTVQDLEQMAQLARGLSVTPASGSDLGVVLGLEHYPVLITATGISQ